MRGAASAFSAAGCGTNGLKLQAMQAIAVRASAQDSAVADAEFVETGIAAARAASRVREARNFSMATTFFALGGQWGHVGGNPGLRSAPVGRGEWGSSTRTRL